METLTPEQVLETCGQELNELIKAHVSPDLQIDESEILLTLGEQIASTINRARDRLTGLYIGRFQPFHKGHLLTITSALKECEKLIIGLGSPYKSHSERHPFTAEERLEMVRLALDEEGIPPERYQIIPIPDIGRPALWTRHVTSITPRFGKVFSGSAYVARLFEEEGGFEVKQLPLLEKDDEPMSATRIRKAIISGDEWESMVPQSVAAEIKRIGGDQRLRAVIDN